MSTSLAKAAGTERSETLRARFRHVRSTPLALAARLTPEDQMVQSCSEASPTKWHLAHTTWFYETFILLPHAPGYTAFNDRFTYLFNSYYKQLDGHPLRTVRGAFSRPSLDEVLAFRAHVDAAINRHFPADDSLLDLLELGVNHEEQHQELIVTDIKHAFWTNP